MSRPPIRFPSPIAFVLAAAVAVPLPTDAADRVTGRAFATRSEVLATNAMAATSQPLATQIALEILRAGGSAVDAAIAANAALALMEPTGCGLGGDLFAIVWDPEERRPVGLNASGRAPQTLTREAFVERGLDRIPPYGPLPVTVPGAVDGWFELHERYGKLPMEKVLAPAIRYAREGFPVSELIAHYWGRGAARLQEWPGFADVFMPDGRAPRAGEVFRNPALASTLELLAKDGRDAFYRGPVAEAIDAYFAEHGGYLTKADLAAHRSEWVEPVSADYRGVELWELPPNTQGIAALQILEIVEAFDVASMGFGSPDWIHLFVEAKKLAFADRARWYADPDFADQPIAALISEEYAATRRVRIDPDRAADSVDPGNPALEEGDTIYLTTADSDRMMVSLIQSNYRGMGSGMTPPGLGFILQDRGELFSLEEGHPNALEPGKRPFHTIIPAFVTRGGEPWISFGVMGGATQPQAHVQVLVNLVDFGMGLQEAGDAPRILHQGSSQPTGETMTDGGRVSLEAGIDWETIRTLVGRGHDVGWNVGSYGGYQAILWDADEGVYHGASESRKDGQAAGF